MRSSWKRMRGLRVLTAPGVERRAALERRAPPHACRQTVGARAEHRAGRADREEAERLERHPVELTTRNPVVAKPRPVRNHLVADRPERVTRSPLLHVAVDLAQPSELVEEAAEL